MKPLVEAFFDRTTCTVTYVVHAGDGSACAVIDSVLDYDPKAGRTSTQSADKVVELVQARGLRGEWLLETHAHADHLPAAQYLKTRLGGRIAIGESIRAVQVRLTIFLSMKNGRSRTALLPGEQFINASRNTGSIERGRFFGRGTAS